MNRRGIALAGLATAAMITGVAAAGAPALGIAAAKDRGVTIDSAGWCETGLCLHGVRAPAVHGLTAQHVAVDWDGSVRVVGATVSLSRGTPDPAASSAPPSSSAPNTALPAYLGPVRVEALTVEGTPLPPLSGELWPERHLAGEGVTVDGDVAEADVASEWGPLHVRVGPSPTGRGYKVSATSQGLSVPATLLGEPFTLADLAADGVWFDGEWEGTVSAGALQLPARVVQESGGGTAHLTLADVPVSALYEALAPLIPEVRHAHVLGVASAQVTLTAKDGTVELDVAQPTLSGFRVDGLVSDALRSNFSYATRDAAGAPSTRTAGPEVAGWTPLHAFGTLLPAAVIAAEDAGFYKNPGYDLQSMVNAAADNLARGTVRRGGNTLTQQLAKNLYLDGTRTYVRKMRELLYAVNLENTIGKRGVLETYLNIVEFGPGIYGATTATDRYFLKSPAGLLPEEAAWLASILPSPRTAWAEQYGRDRPNTAKVNAILDNMVSLSDSDRAAAKGRALRFVH